MVEQLRRDFVQGPAFDLQGYLGMSGGRGGVGSGGRVEPTQFPGGSPGSINIDMGGGGAQQSYQQGPLDNLLQGFGSGAGQALATGIPEKVLQFQQEQKRAKSMSVLDRALSKVSPDDREGKLDAILHAPADDETKQLRLQYENAKDLAHDQKQQKDLASKQQEAMGQFLNQQQGGGSPNQNSVNAAESERQPGESPQYDIALQQVNEEAKRANQEGRAPNLPPVQQTDFRRFSKEDQKTARIILQDAQKQVNEDKKIAIQQQQFELEQTKFAHQANKEMETDWRKQYDVAKDSLNAVDDMRISLGSGNVGPHKIRSLMAASKNPIISGLANPESQAFVASGVKLIGNLKENFGGVLTDAKLGIIANKLAGVSRLPEANEKLLDMAETSLMPKKLRYEEMLKLKKENNGVLPLGADWIVEERIQPKLRELDARINGIIDPLLTEEERNSGLFGEPAYVRMTNAQTGETIEVHPDDVQMAAKEGFQ